jgi:hypothetical protein
MGRPRKVKTQEEIKAEIEALQSQLTGVNTNKIDGVVASKLDDVTQDDVKEIRPDEYITIMSLLPYTLILSTLPMGGGSVKRFTKFGETKRVLYSDLIDIIENCQSFLEAGYFFILDNRVIRRHGLDEVYSKILTKEKIQEIVDSKSENAVDLYKSATPRQQETIIHMLVDKIKASPETVDMNIVDRISRVSGVDILKNAENEKEIENTEAVKEE